jgi:hypothetical protein
MESWLTTLWWATKAAEVTGLPGAFEHHMSALFRGKHAADQHPSSWHRKQLLQIAGRFAAILALVQWVAVIGFASSAHAHSWAWKMVHSYVRPWFSSLGIIALYDIVVVSGVIFYAAMSLNDVVGAIQRLCTHTTQDDRLDSLVKVLKAEFKAIMVGVVSVRVGNLA